MFSALVRRNILAPLSDVEYPESSIDSDLAITLETRLNRLDLVHKVRKRNLRSTTTPR